MAPFDGIFTQPGPNGIFGRGGTPGDPTSPPIDSDGTPLRETLLVAYPSPGHMRVARAIRHAKTGHTEFQEEYRVPTPEEAQMLKEQGLTVGPGSMVTGGALAGLGEDPPPVEAPGVVAAIKRQPWVRIGLGVAVGVAGSWAYGKYVAPMFSKPKRRNPRSKPVCTCDPRFVSSDCEIHGGDDEEDDDGE